MHEAADAHERSADIRTTIEASLAGKIRRQLKAGKNPKEIAAMFGTSTSYDGQAADRRGWACNCSRQQWHRPEIRAAAATESGIGGGTDALERDLVRRGDSRI